MGYELVKLDDQDEPYEVTNWDDPNYFRMNTEIIGRVRNIALWGIGLISGEEMIRYTSVVSASDNENLPVEDLVKMHAVAPELHVSWLEPFTTTNPKTIPKAMCLLFAENLDIGLRMISDSPIKPDYELDIMVHCVEFLRNCPNGVWLE